jgi:hypothetical protein
VKALNGCQVFVRSVYDSSGVRITYCYVAEPVNMKDEEKMLRSLWGKERSPNGWQISKTKNTSGPSQEVAQDLNLERSALSLSVVTATFLFLLRSCMTL